MNSILGKGWTLDGKEVKEEEIIVINASTPTPTEHQVDTTTTSPSSGGVISLDKFRHVNSILVANLKYSLKTMLQVDPSQLKSLESSRGVSSLSMALNILLGKAIDDSTSLESLQNFDSGAIRSAAMEHAISHRVLTQLQAVDWATCSPAALKKESSSQSSSAGDVARFIKAVYDLRLATEAGAVGGGLPEAAPLSLGQLMAA